MSRSLSTLAALAAAALLPASAAHAGQVVVTDATTGDTTWTVPAGVTSIDLHAVGQHGAPGGMGGSAGGRGGAADGTLAVTPGAVLTLRVGSGGGAPSGALPGGAGGGLSGVLSAGAFQLVAAGGGGGGWGTGSGAGGDADADGVDGSGGAGGQGGGRGTTAAGGSAGGGAAVGTAGTAGAGGTGGGASNAGGGGGGAGLFGGGGGGGGAPGPIGAGGGGGGASYTGPSVSGGTTGLTTDPLPSIRLVYADGTAPGVVLGVPIATNPAVLAGTAGTDTGDDPHVTLALYHGSDTTGPVATTISGAAADDGQYSVPVPPLADGTWTAIARQDDAGGNTGASLAWTFTVDRTAPAVALSAFAATLKTARPAFGGSTTGAATQVTLVVDGHDAASSVTLAAPVAADGTFSAQPSQDLPDGPYSVLALASDAAGNTALSAPVAFTIDTSVPSPALVALPVTTPPAQTQTQTRPTTAKPAATAPKLKLSLTTKATKNHRAAVSAKVAVSGAAATGLRVCLSGPPIGKKSKCWSSKTALAAGKSKTYTFTATRSGTVRAIAAAAGAVSASATKAIKIR
jgi:hypothetical protein